MLDTVVVNAGDSVVLEWMRHPDAAVGIDCPFGWPKSFVDLASRDSTQALEIPEVQLEGWRRPYVLRATDIWVHKHHGLMPLGVAADRLGHAAVRLAALIATVGPAVNAALDGSGALAEVYPAAALKKWDLPFRGYMGTANLIARNQLVDALKAAPWLELGEHGRPFEPLTMCSMPSSAPSSFER